MFKVTIEEAKTVTKPGGKEWVIVGSQEVERDDRYRAEPAMNWKNISKTLWSIAALWVCAYLMHFDFNWWRAALVFTVVISTGCVVCEIWRKGGSHF